MARLSNPFSFTRWPVTIFTSAIYLAIGIALIVVHTTVPSPPRSPTPIHGINLTEAWADLQALTASHHPYNGHANDQVRAWLLERVGSIVKENDANAHIFDDTSSNLTFSSSSASLVGGISVYFEGTNLIAYVPGTQDDPSEWWRDPSASPSTRQAVLVNAHYDSVSTSYGATDDGVGVICVLQLLRYFTTAKNQPKNGVVLLWNNGEEDFLNGASVFGQHPISKVVASFLNLEGAGAGGRAALFRSTDEAVTRAYGRSKYPFASSTLADGFNSGFVRSQTDYVVFNGILGYRGLDVAFIRPRARYHTNEDDAKHTSKSSLWHMLSAAVSTTQALTSASLQTNYEPGNTPGSPPIFFDVFGRVFAVLKAHSFFALSVTLLVAGPVILLLTMFLLYRLDKFYLFSGSRPYHQPDGDDEILLYGWRGFFRFPMILLFASAVPVALAYLLFKENQYIAHSSEWAVWSMMASSFIFVAWFFCRAADFTRPSSLTRAYGYSWIWLGWWALLVAATVFEEHFHLVGLYFVLVYAATVWLATWLSYLELLSLPKKAAYCRGKVSESGAASPTQGAVANPALDRENDDTTNEDEEPTERSSLLRSGGRSTFKGYRSEDHDEDRPDEHKSHTVQEQLWSQSQWSSLWLLQLLVTVPINLILVGQLGLLVTDGIHQTGQDGSSMFLLYILVASSTIILFSPVVPILHRFTWHIPIFLFFVLVATLIYNLTAFPFSQDSRLKLFFQQQVDLEGGNNTVSLTGVKPFVRHAVSEIPSSAGQKIVCIHAGPSDSSNMERCSWAGIPPNVANQSSSLLPEDQYAGWLTFNVTRLNASDSDNKARFVVSGQNTRACKLVFENAPITAFHVQGQAPRDKRFTPVPKGGSGELRLWSRTWGRAWTVDVSWDNPASSTAPSTDISTDATVEADGPLRGKVVCLWSDVNENGVIPAFDEAVHYVPAWAALTKVADGLVEGYKTFQIS